MARKRNSLVVLYGRRHPRYLELIRAFALRPIRSEAELDAAIVVIDSLLDRKRLAEVELDYPKVRPAPATEIELLGNYKFNAEWTVKAAKVVFTPKVTGGVYSAPTELKFLDGKGGALDPKDKTKIVPAIVPLGKGEWSVWVFFTLEGKDASGTKVEVPFLATIKNVDVK